MSSLCMMNLSCNDIHAEWVGRVCRFLRGVWRGALASGNCCVMCNLVLLRLFFTAEREEEDWEFDRGINLCLRLLTENCVCVWVCVCVVGVWAKAQAFINQATIFSDPNALLCAYFLFFAAKLNIRKMSLDLYIVLSCYSLELKTAALLG